MRNLVPTLLPRLEAHQLNSLDAGPEAMYPYYDGYSLVNLAASICHWLGIPPMGNAPFRSEILGLYERGFPHVILLVVDGFGLNTFQHALQLAESDPDYAVWGEMAQAGALAPITSIVPSTTSAALTTFWTGASPAEHGIVGYEVWLKELGLIANMILHSPASYVGDIGSLQKAGFNPQTFLPVARLGPHLLQHGIRPRAFQHISIARSGLSNMLMEGVEVNAYRSLSDLWVTLGAMLDDHSVERSYTYIYWGSLDEHSHHFGPEDPRVALELTEFSRQLGHFYRERRKHSHRDTLLLITADHGHISTPPNPDFEIRNHPELLADLVMVPSGEARLPFVYLRPGRKEHFLHYLEETWSGLFRPVPAQEAIRSGLFGGGDIYARLPDRVGDYVIIPQDNAYWWFADRNNSLLGRHGGLSRTEMQVPLFSTVF